MSSFSHLFWSNVAMDCAFCPICSADF